MTSNTIDMLQQFFAVKLLMISLVSVIAPILSEKMKWIFVPSIIFELVLGMLIGPQVFNWVQPVFQIDVLATIGLTFLIFLAGFGINLEKIRGKPLLLASISWLLSLLLAVIFVFGMTDVGLTLEIAVVSLALTTTALGALLPILQDTHNLKSKFGIYVLATGTMGQFGPILLVSLLFTKAKPEVTGLFLVFFVVVAVIAALFVMKFQQWKSVQFIRNHLHLSSQLPVRMSMFLIFALVCLAISLKLNVLLGSFAAGIITQFFISKQDRDVVDSKLKAIGYSFIIPLFFIVSGMKFDLHALFSLDAVSRMLFFFLCLLVIRAVPIFIFFHRQIARTEQQALAFFSATGLPLIVVITHLGMESGKMLSINAVALVGAGVLSVLIFPVLGLSRLTLKT